MRLFSGTHQRAFFIWDRTEPPAGMDQATVLKRFIEAARSGEQKAEDQYSSDFMRLRRLSTKYRTEKIYPTSVGEREENVKKNRYKDILPFDHSRVKLTLKTSNQDSDYINANFIKGIVRSDSYIATQGPLPNTMLDFWRMIWEYDVTVIVMACREFEMGRKKCERYFPMLGDEKMLIGPFQISCESEQPQTDYIIRNLSVEFCQKNRRLTQFHYMNWPDHDVPSSFDSILDMIEVMREYQQHDHMPICVHCSAGCGRTGAICAIDYTRNLLKAGRVPDDFNVFQLIQEMRTQRHSAVQTKEQYELVHRAITQLFEKQLKCLETDGMDESSPEKLAPNSDEEHWDVPPPKPPRLRSHPAEDDVKEEILQPPEPRPVPPILTPSPPSAFPTVTDVRQDNDRYHPKPILHVLTTDRQPDLNENYQPPVLITQPPSPSPSVELTRPPERKLSIEIKKVPLQEGPRSFEGNGALQRAHAFKRSNTSSSSASEDSDDPPRPNHLPLKANKGHAAHPVSTPDRGDRTPSPAPSCATTSTPPRTALSFTNPLHSDHLDEEGHSADRCSGVTVATSTVSVASQGCPSPRKVTSMSIAGQNIPTPDSLDGTDGTVVTVTSAASSSSQGPGEAETPSPQLSACHLHSHTPSASESHKAAAAEEEGNPRLSPADDSRDPEFGSRCAHPKGPREPPSEWT